jgi:YHS domain-containing protein
LKYKGKTYYFCCSNCPDMFKKNPDKYIKKQPAAKKAQGK